MAFTTLDMDQNRPADRPVPDCPIVAIVGPTGAGKSEAAIRLAERVGGEIISADSQQVYRGMDIGTGKVDAAVRARIAHHLIDIVDPDQDMTAALFAKLADRAICDATRRGKPVIVAGGTGLYVRALLFGLFEGPGRDAELRRRLHAEAESRGGPPALWQRLQAIDPACAERVDCNDLRRIVRALEVYELTGVPMSEHQKQHDFRTMSHRYRAHLVGIAPERTTLYQRIESRVDAMMARGLEREVRRLRTAGYGPALRSQAAIGYAELHRYLDGRQSLDQAIQLIKRNSTRYARRQLSWYRNDQRIPWHCEPSDIDLEALERYLRS
ncbi:MAG: tRNA (adenosine(37)-N6)-dimethylallyltransferase MiaA [Proteobacteria bacterium]|nr:tRNA (adenosine(37)-N6)-dimethylallyltransferase MiaA [Pseudomonadota bacterium]